MGAAVGDFFQLAVGGLGWGTLCALVVLFWLWLSIWAPRAEVMVVIMATFATYFFGEHSLHVSGVLATVAFGVMYAYVVKFFMSIKAQEMSHELWEEVGYLANTIIFVIAGILIYNEAFERENPLGFQVQLAFVLLLVDGFCLAASSTHCLLSCHIASLHSGKAGSTSSSHTSSSM